VIYIIDEIAGRPLTYSASGCGTTRRSRVQRAQRSLELLVVGGALIQARATLPDELVWQCLLKLGILCITAIFPAGRVAIIAAPRSRRRNTDLAPPGGGRRGLKPAKAAANISPAFRR
jgi:hypothetical protein